MANAKFITVKGTDRFGSSPFYVGIVQHERTMSKKETYEYLAEQLGFRPAAIRAAVMALAQVVRGNAERGNITCIDGVASIRNVCKGSFAGLYGPWVKGRNFLVLDAVELSPFRTLLADMAPANNAEGAKPVINTVLDETTREYDVITGTDPISVAGADLAPNAMKDDEFAALVRADGTVAAKFEITYSDLQNVKLHLAAPVESGVYTMEIHTRSGMGDAYGVHTASRKVAVA